MPSSDKYKSKQKNYNKPKDVRTQAYIDTIKQNWGVTPAEVLSIIEEDEVPEAGFTMLEKIAKLSSIQGDLRLARETLLRHNSARIASYKKVRDKKVRVTKHISIKDIENATEDFSSVRGKESDGNTPEENTGRNLRVHRRPSVKKAEADASLRNGSHITPQKSQHDASGTPDVKRRRTFSPRRERDQTPTELSEQVPFLLGQQETLESLPQETRSVSPGGSGVRPSVEQSYTENNLGALPSSPFLGGFPFADHDKFDPYAPVRFFPESPTPHLEGPNEWMLDLFRSPLSRLRQSIEHNMQNTIRNYFPELHEGADMQLDPGKTELKEWVKGVEEKMRGLARSIEDEGLEILQRAEDNANGGAFQA